MKSERNGVTNSGIGRKSALLAHKAGIGGIFFHEESSNYELRLEMEQCKDSYFMTAKEWEEFIEFSGQDERAEFFIILEQSYPKLFNCLKDDSMRMGFLNLIEATYDGSQPSEKE
jgi:hypothetical protein